MKIKINVEWRKKDEPDLDPEFVVEQRSRLQVILLATSRSRASGTKINQRCLKDPGMKPGYLMR